MLPLSPVLNMRSRRVAPPALPTPTGLDFPSNDDPDGTVQFRFTSTARPTIVPLSMIWKFRPRQQTGYYTTFFHARGDGTFIGDNTYFGCHPYPKTGTSAGTTHWWEVSIEGADDVTDENANDTTVEYDRWYSQFAVSQNVASQGLVDFYYDLDAGRSRYRSDAPIAPGHHWETHLFRTLAHRHHLRHSHGVRGYSLDAGAREAG